MSDLINRGDIKTPTDILIDSTEEVEDAEYAIIILANKSGKVEVRWSAMCQWQAKGIFSEAYDVITEAWEEEDEQVD